MSVCTWDGFSYSKSLQIHAGVRKHVRAAKLVKDNSQLAAHAKSFASTGQVSVQTSKEVNEAFKGTALVMTKKAWIRLCRNLPSSECGLPGKSQCTYVRGQRQSWLRS